MNSYRINGGTLTITPDGGETITLQIVCVDSEMRKGYLGKLEGFQFIDVPALSDALRRSMPAPVHHEPRSKTAQWKRERSPMRYSSRR